MRLNIGGLFLLINILLTPISMHFVNIKKNSSDKSKVITINDEPDRCVIDKFQCTKSSQCCSKLCTSLVVINIQFCSKSLDLEMSTEKPITFFSENCKPNNGLCQKDDQCCSKQCVPIGFGKLNACIE